LPHIRRPASGGAPTVSARASGRRRVCFPRPYYHLQVHALALTLSSNRPNHAVPPEPGVSLAALYEPAGKIAKRDAPKSALDRLWYPEKRLASFETILRTFTSRDLAAEDFQRPRLWMFISGGRAMLGSCA